MPFVHLRTHSHYSVGDGIITVANLTQNAAADGQVALALTDANNLFGTLQFYRAARAAGVKPLVGCEVWLGHTSVVLLAQNQTGYWRICQWLSQLWLTHAYPGLPKLTSSCLTQTGTEGVLALAGAQAFELGELNFTELSALHQAFPGRFYVELQRLGRPNEEQRLGELLAYAAQQQLPVVATHPVQFLRPADYEAHEARVCIAEGEILGNTRRVRRFTEQQYFKTQAEMSELFADLPAALENTLEIAKRCNLEFDLGKPQLPAFPTEAGVSMDQALRDQAQQGLLKRLNLHVAADAKAEVNVNAESVPLLDEQLSSAAATPASSNENISFESAVAQDLVPTEYAQRLAFECDTIIKMGFPGYFLIVADFINWAKNNGVPVGPGRGSGAGSLVAYCLGITDLDPLKYKLLFERFLNPERVSMPDFDIDFCQEGRDRVIDYVRQKYGHDSVAQIVTFGTLAAKAAVRDVGRVLDLPYGFVDGIAKLIPFQPGKTVTISKRVEGGDDTLVYAREVEPLLEERERDEEDVAALLDLAARVEGLVRNVGMHAGGVLIAPGKLTDFCPLYSADGGKTVVAQFDKDDVEAIGLVKFDFLGLTTLTILAGAVRLIHARYPEHQSLDLATIPLDAPRAFQILRTANTVAVFQLESRGMQDMLLKAQPDRFEDIIALVALYRPGPMDLIPDFCERKHGRQKVVYLHPDAEEILRETYGIMVYQEQVMQMAQRIGAYTLGAADLLRRAMGKKKAEEMAQHRAIFAEGAAQRGISAAKANEIFDLMEKFAGYGFNKSHAAAYALLAYQTAWLKAHFPAEFFAANMSCALDDTDKIRVLWDDARRRNGIELLLPDINHSDYRFIPVGEPGVPAKVVRYGLGGIKGTGEGAVMNILRAHQEKPFSDFFDFVARIDRRVVNRRTLEALIRAGAFDSLGTDRGTLLASLELALDWAEQRAAAAHQVSLFDDDAPEQQAPAYVTGQSWTLARQLAEEKTVFGFSLSGHLFDAHRDEVRRFVATPLAKIKPGRDAQTLAGVVTGVRTVMGRRGKMVILTLDDASAQQEVVVFAELFDQHRALLVEDAVLIVTGQVRNDDFSGGMRINAEKIQSLAQARAQKAKFVRFTCDHAEPDISVLMSLLPVPREQGVRVQLQLQHNGVSGALMLPESCLVHADEAALRQAMVQTRASHYEWVY